MCPKKCSRHERKHCDHHYRSMRYHSPHETVYVLDPNNQNYNMPFMAQQYLPPMIPGGVLLNRGVQPQWGPIGPVPPQVLPGPSTVPIAQATTEPAYRTVIENVPNENRFYRGQVEVAHRTHMENMPIQNRSDREQAMRMPGSERDVETIAAQVHSRTEDKMFYNNKPVSRQYPNWEIANSIGKEIRPSSRNRRHRRPREKLYIVDSERSFHHIPSGIMEDSEFYFKKIKKQYLPYERKNPESYMMKRIKGSQVKIVMRSSSSSDSSSDASSKRESGYINKMSDGNVLGKNNKKRVHNKLFAELNNTDSDEPVRDKKEARIRKKKEKWFAPESKATPVVKPILSDKEIKETFSHKDETRDRINEMYDLIREMKDCICPGDKPTSNKNSVRSRQDLSDEIKFNKSSEILLPTNETYKCRCSLFNKNSRHSTEISKKYRVSDELLNKPSRFSEDISPKPSRFSEHMSSKHSRFSEDMPTKSSRFSEDMPTKSSRFSEDMPTKPSRFSESMPTKSSRFSESMPTKSSRFSEDANKFRHSEASISESSIEHSNPSDIGGSEEDVSVDIVECPYNKCQCGMAYNRKNESSDEVYYEHFSAEDK